MVKVSSRRPQKINQDILDGEIDRNNNYNNFGGEINEENFDVKKIEIKKII